MQLDAIHALLMQSLPEGVEGPVALTLRDKGKATQRAWCESHVSTADNLREALTRLKPQIGKQTVIELNAVYDMQPLPALPSQLPAVQRGLRGIRLRYETLSETLPPTTMIARNLGFNRATQKFAARVTQELGLYDASKLQAEWFASHQRLYIPCSPLEGEPKRQGRKAEADSVGGQSASPSSDPPPNRSRDLTPPQGGSDAVVIAMYRGNRIVPPEDVTLHSTQALADGMADWLKRHTHDDGRITYKYWPSKGEESDGVNLIRLFMAVLCLFRIAAWKQCVATKAQAMKALRYHLTRFYRQEGALGYVLEGDKVKLGACALAGLCIEASGEPEMFAREREGIAAMVEHLWQIDGSFRTFFRPDGRDDCQNFYPGEALLYWAECWRHSGDEALLAQIMESFNYYRKWHRAQPNPAFIPWHTQAYFAVWQRTQSDALRDFIFEMNDWLLPVQQWDEIDYPDEWGRFHDPNRPFGPPHASSTGVYIEGLIDAWQLARAVEDSARMKAYETAMRRALRSLMQLQYKDEVDMFYISRRNRVLGALRTTCYHNEIRVDNVQHGLMGIIKLLDEGLLA